MILRQTYPGEERTINAIRRRAEILSLIAKAQGPITGAYLAEKFGVTRQVIVRDIALLRAAGHPIIATPQGYLQPGTAETMLKIRRSFVVCHPPDPQAIETELNAIVDLGGHVLDVIVEHPVYGDLTGVLMINSRRDVQAFIDRLVSSKAEPLLVLREGVHLHTVEANHEAELDAIADELRRLGFLVEADN